MRKPGRASEIPPPLELACLRALWRIGEGSVKDVRGVITENRNLAYTTVMTVLERLAKRGAVERKKSGRAFVYLPLMQREQARRLAVRELADTYFEGSIEHLKTYLGGAEISVPPAPAPPPAQTVAENDLDETLL
jgi:predicted transcriptional regulator